MGEKPLKNEQPPPKPNQLITTYVWILIAEQTIKKRIFLLTNLRKFGIDGLFDDIIIS